MTHTYDAQGNLERSHDDAGVTVESTYDAKNRIKTRNWFDSSGNNISDVGIQFNYDTIGHPIVINRYSDRNATELVASTSRTYDRTGRSRGLIHSVHVEQLTSFEYEYSFAGSLLKDDRVHRDTRFEQSVA